MTPAENGLTIIGGRNNQGKTSVLDALMWALGGDRLRPSKAQRDGSMIPPRLKVTLNNGIVVERSGKNSSLKVTDANGQKAGQTLLNAFIEQLALDMPRFMQSSSREKADTLLRIIGLKEEIAALERDADKLYNERRAIGQIADQKEKYAKELPEYPDAPKEPVSAYDLIQSQQAILARNAENQRKREKAAQLEALKTDLWKQKTAMEKELSSLKSRYETVCADCDTAAKDALDLLDESTDALEADIQRIDSINEMVRTNQKKAQAQKEAAAYGDQYTELTSQLEKVRQRKKDLLEGAALPLAGLSVEDGELTYQGKPWDCMSGSDQLKVSAAIVRALKPECGFVLLDKLEQMDLETLRGFSAWMESEGLQGIATRVSTGGECSIIIEDGMAMMKPELEPEPEPESEPAETPAPPVWKGEF